MQTETHSKLAGVSMGKEDGEDRQLNVRQLRDGQELFFIHEKDNPFDSCAIKVFADEAHTKPLGYIQRELAKDITIQGDKMGYKYRIYCTKVTGGGGRTYGCNVKLVIEG
jgi:hypothetical protein